MDTTVNARIKNQLIEMLDGLIMSSKSDDSLEQKALDMTLPRVE